MFNKKNICYKILPNIINQYEFNLTLKNKLGLRFLYEKVLLFNSKRNACAYIRKFVKRKFITIT